jgi:hypothetical protein
MPSRRRHLALALLLAALALAGCGGSSSTTVHRGLLQSMFQDDQYTLYQPTATTVEHTLDTLKALGVDVVRVQVLWANIAPDPTSATRPAGFDASNPAAYPATGWAPYDRLVRLARARGLGVQFDLTAPGPLWAMRHPVPAKTLATVYAPSVSDWRQFVKAVGRRYSGTYTAPGTAGGPLPRVNDWSIWNEPNQPGWLAPQRQTVAGQTVPEASLLYREYADAAFRSLGATGHAPSSDTILFGETAPEGCLSRSPGCEYPADDEPLPPMQFIEALYCVNASYQPLTGAVASALHCPASRRAFVADNPVLFRAAGFAHHPYSFLLAPSVRFGASDVGFVSMANLSTLEQGLDRIFSAYRVSRQLPIYLTEYGYETKPPNPYRGVSPQAQAAYLDEAQYMAWSDPRVRALSQFLLVDSAPDSAFPQGSSGYWSTFQTGLEYLNGRPKPSLDAYLLPVYVPDPTFGSGGSVTVWAMLRPAANGSRQRAHIQWSASAGGAYRTIETVSTDNISNALTVSVKPPGSGFIRIEWTAGVGNALLSRSVAVTRS